MTQNPTEITPNEVLADSPELIPPPEVQELFDLADFEEAKYACRIDPPFVRLTSIDGKTVFKEVEWKKSDAWSRQFMRKLQEVTDAATKLREAGEILPTI